MTRPTRSGVLLALAALALPLGACGAGGSDGTGARASADDRETARLKLEQCMREQGVAPPRREQRGTGGSGMVERRASDAEVEKVRAALEGPCRDEQEAAFGSFTPEDRAAFEDAQLRMNACLKEHGVDLPTPNAEGPTIVRIDPSDDRVREAMEACRDELPEGMRGGPGEGPMMFGGPAR